MYIPPAYEVTDWSEITSFISQARAGEFVTVNKDGTPEASTLPFTWYPQIPDPSSDVKNYGRATTHMARSNPQWREIEDGAPALIIVSGAGAYISPTNYASTPVTGKEVGIWAYQVAHLRGSVRVIHEADEILKIVSDLQNDHEEDREIPWDLASANQDFIHELVKHVVGFTVEITSVEAKFKLEQKQSASDRRATIDDLRRSGRPDDLAIATQIERFL